jgi:large-conductance mechanosensitive channel
MINKILAATSKTDISLEAPEAFKGLRNISFGSIVGGLIQYVLIIAAIVFFFVLLIGGIKWMTSEGDEKKVGAAKAQLTNALVGLAIIFGAWAIMGLINQMFGVDILNLALPAFE